MIGGASAAAFYGVGHGSIGALNEGIGNVIGHAAVGCLQSVAGGGSCQSGALAAGFGAAFSQYCPGCGMAGKGLGPVVANTVIHAVIGGTASVLGGGKFENGAMSAAMGYLFNQAAGKKDGALGKLRKFFDLKENIDTFKAGMTDGRQAAAKDLQRAADADALKTQRVETETLSSPEAEIARRAQEVGNAAGTVADAVGYGMQKGAEDAVGSLKMGSLPGKSTFLGSIGYGVGQIYQRGWRPAPTPAPTLTPEPTPSLFFPR